MNVKMSTVCMVEHVLMDWVPILVPVYKVILVPTVKQSLMCVIPSPVNMEEAVLILVPIWVLDMNVDVLWELQVCVLNLHFFVFSVVES